jgi:FtsH-binding integral membrane protein
MPKLSYWFIRTALIYFLLGFTLGALLLAQKGFPFAPWLWRWRQAHIEFLLLGWTVQLVLGVAFWILPRFQTSRGNVQLAWLAYFLLNTGILLVVLTPVIPLPPITAVAGRVAEVAAASSFVLHGWSRVKPPSF